MPASDASPAVAVERALNILEAAANRRDGMTNSEISRKLAIPKSSASYICAPSNGAATCGVKRKRAATASASRS